jgi:hypothetical protein
MNTIEFIWKSRVARIFFFSLLIVAMGITCYGIVFQTNQCTHPDSRYHLYAFTYFEDHWWPPDVNSDDLVYSPYGASRVYSGETVYLIYGKIIHLVKNLGLLQQFDRPYNVLETPYAVCKEGVVYGSLNSILFLVTLSILFYKGLNDPIPAGLGLLMTVIPQVTYLYSYSNSDAWGLSLSIFLFLFYLYNQDTWYQSIWKACVLGILTGLLITSKKSFWISIIFVYALILIDIVGEIKKQNFLNRKFVLSLGLVILMAVILITPINIIYPNSQENFKSGMATMLNQRAGERFNPKNPQVWSYRASSQGVPFLDLIQKNDWMQISLKSFYGVFGHMTVYSPDIAYRISGITISLLCTLTFISLFQHWKALSKNLKLMLLISPAAIIVNILLSMRHSWIADFQPQGRYLFASIIPLAISCSGLAKFENRWIKGLRGLTWCGLYVLNLYILWFVVIINPELG